MDCRRFTEILANFIGEELPSQERSLAHEHLAMCSDCRRLLEVANGQLDLLPPELSADFTRSVLIRTSGNSCVRAKSVLWDFEEGGLNAEESQLISLHLDHCPECSVFAEQIAFARKILPSFAEMDPGEVFTKRVVGRTSGRRRVQPDFQTRLQAWWDRMVRRPLFSFEAAYVASLFLFFVFSPVLPFRELAIQKLPSLLTNAGKPAGAQIQNLTSIMSWGNRVVAASVDDAWDKTESSLNSMADRSLQSIRNWQRGCTAEIKVFRKRLSNPAGKGR